MEELINEEQIKKEFLTLLSLDVNDKTEKRKGNDGSGVELTYLSWTYAWSEFKKVYPKATYEIVKFTNKDGETVPYMYDKNTGYMCCTRVYAGLMSYEMWLPVMNSNNKAMKSEQYTYTTKKGEKTVEAATMFDVNKTLMRCLVKNLAMFGLGLYIYAGEDLPEKITDPSMTPEMKSISIVDMISSCKTEEELSDVYKKNKTIICKTPELLDLITKAGQKFKKDKVA